MPAALAKSARPVRSRLPAAAADPTRPV